MERDEAGQRGGDQDLRGPVGGEESGDERAESVDGSEQVHLQEAEPLVRRHLPRRAEGRSDDAGVQAHDGDARCRRREGLHVIGIGHVECVRGAGELSGQVVGR